MKQLLGIPAHATITALVAIGLAGQLPTDTLASGLRATGIGCFFDERVPADGTSVDFTPRAAVGAHLALDATTAVSARVGWLHLSNAQTGENNPGIDTLAVSLGLHIAY